jgi:transcription termination/antitermination protein NusG
VSDWTHRFRDRFSQPDPGNRPRIGDAATVTDGTFESFEGTIAAVDEELGKITILIEIFGRSTPVEVEYWQVKRI